MAKVSAAGGGPLQPNDIQVTFTHDAFEDPISPPIVDRVEYNGTEKRNTITDMCGRTETEITSDHKTDLTVEGIAFAEDIRGFHHSRVEGLVLDVTSSIVSGPFRITDAMFIRNSDMNDLEMESGRKEAGFSFQLQMDMQRSDS